MANIKFFRKNSAPSNPQEGYVWFNNSDRTISLYKNGAWEKYSGILGASYTNKVLTITPATGTAVTVDLSDMASASTLSTLSQNFNTLQTNFNTLSGEFTTEKGKISTLQGEMTTVKTEVAKLSDVTGKVGAYVVEKISAHEKSRETIDAGFNSRIGALETKDGVQDGRLDALEAFKNAEGGVVDGKISAAIGGLDSEKKGEGTYVDVTVKLEDGKVTNVTVDESDLTTRLNGIDSTISTGLAGINDKIGGSYDSTNTVAKAIEAAAAAAAAAQADIDAWNSATKDTDGVIETITELNQYITDHTNAFTGLSQRVGTAESNISTLEGKVDVTKVSTAIATAKTEAINAAASDAAAKADNAKSGAISEANSYTDTQVSALANGAVKTNTADIATLKSDVETIEGQITTINATIEENELVIAEALNDLNTRVDSLASGTVTSVTGQNYITATTTDGDVTVSATTGSVANGVNALAVASDVKSYVDSCWTWGEF